MLLTFSWSREIYPKHFHARAFALINMIIALCGYQFQTWFGILENTAKNSSAQLLHGLWLFALPLFLAIPLCYWGSIRIKEINEE